MANERLGFIGLGAMGMPMTLNLLKAGRDVTVWGRNAARLAPAIERGAKRADSAARLTETVDIVHLCVTDTNAVEDVVFGPNGIAEGGAAGKLVVDHSSIHPSRTQEIARRLATERGMGWIDAPVSGGARGAEDATLIVMAGGAVDELARVRPALEAMAKQISHVGPVGAGQGAKMCNQMIIGATIAVCAEALKLAREVGIDPKILPDVLKGGWADSAVMQNHARRMAAGEFGPPPAPGSLTMLKDMLIAVETGQAVGAPLPVTSLVTSLYTLVMAQGRDTGGQIGLMRLYTDGAP